MVGVWCLLVSAKRPVAEANTSRVKPDRLARRWLGLAAAAASVGKTLTNTSREAGSPNNHQMSRSDKKNKN